MASDANQRIRGLWCQRLKLRGWTMLIGTLFVALLGTSILLPRYRVPPSGPAASDTPAHEPLPSEPAPATGWINILLLGIDARQEGEPARSDALILVSLDPKTQDAAMLSIPRESRVFIPGRGPDKIAHAHAFGGVDLAVQTVEANFGVPVHHWVRIDMPRFLKLVDVLGPVTVNVPYDLRLRNGRQLEAGPHQMDSELVLAYLRERYSDPSGDFGRADRQ